MSQLNKSDIRNFSHNVIFAISITVVLFIIGIAIAKELYQITFHVYSYIFTLGIFTINVTSALVFGFFALFYMLKKYQWKFLLLMIPLYFLYDIIWNILTIVHYGFSCMFLTTYSNFSWIEYIIILIISSISILYITDTKINDINNWYFDTLLFWVFLIIDGILDITSNIPSCTDLLYKTGQVSNLYTFGNIENTIIGIASQSIFLISFRNLFKK